MQKKRIWMGRKPEECDLCGNVLKKVFVDGRVQETGGWAIMCSSCHAQNGEGLGLGVGQKYRLNKKTGDFEKVAG